MGTPTQTSRPQRDLGEPSCHRTSTWISLLPPGGHRRSSEWAHQLRLPCHKGTNGNQAVTGHQLGFMGRTTATTPGNRDPDVETTSERSRKQHKASKGRARDRRNGRDGTARNREKTDERPTETKTHRAAEADRKPTTERRRTPNNEDDRTKKQRNTNEPNRNEPAGKQARQKKKVQHMI